MIERLKLELNLIEASFGELELGSNFDWFIIKSWKLGVGWNKVTTSVLVMIPPGYPVTPPDNFYTDPDLRLANGGLPGNCSENQCQIGRQWLQFSYHIESGDWISHAELERGHNLLTFLHGVQRRLVEVS